MAASIHDLWQSPSAVKAAEALKAVAPSDRSTASYTFTRAFPADHFVSKYLDYATQRTDAAHEFHEGNGLLLLAAATPNVRACLGPYPNGLGTNLYQVHLGDSTTSRKTTAQETAKDLHDRAIPGSVLAQQSTPEAYAEQIAGRPRQSCTSYVDEFAELLQKIEHRPYMSGFKELLLTLYGGGNYTIKRASTRSGSQKSENNEVIERPHLNFIGCCTPTLFDSLTEAEVLSGLLARFAIIWPTSKPARRPFYEVSAGLEGDRDELVYWIRTLHTWATDRERVVRFDAGALALVDEFAERIERDAQSNADGAAKALLQRLMPMALKIAMLSASGHQDATERPQLVVSADDATSALMVAERWKGYAIAFAQHVGQNETEKRVSKCLGVLQKLEGMTERRNVAKRAHLAKRELDAVEETLIDRGLITVIIEPATSGPATKYWKVAE